MFMGYLNILDELKPAKRIPTAYEPPSRNPGSAPVICTRWTRLDVYLNIRPHREIRKAYRLIENKFLKLSMRLKRISDIKCNNVTFYGVVTFYIISKLVQKFVLVTVTAAAATTTTLYDPFIAQKV